MQFAADAAKRQGEPERGLAILERAGDFHQALFFAREAGLHERVEEMQEKLEEDKRRHEREKLQRLWYGPPAEESSDDAKGEDRREGLAGPDA